MRALKNLESDMQKRLRCQYSEILALYACEENTGYKKAFISVFDHWLTHAEAWDYLYDISRSDSEKFNKLLHGFSVSLVQSSESYLVKLRGRHSKKVPVFKEFTSIDSMLQKLTPKPHLFSPWGRFVLIFPKLNTVYFENSDFTHVVYYKSEKDLDFFKAVAESSGLHVLQF